MRCGAKTKSEMLGSTILLSIKIHFKLIYIGKSIHWFKCIICELSNLQNIKASDKWYIENFNQIIIHDGESTSIIK